MSYKDYIGVTSKDEILSLLNADTFMFDDMSMFPGLPVLEPDNEKIAELTSLMEASVNIRFDLKENMDHPEPLFQERSIVAPNIYLKGTHDHDEPVYMTQIKKRRLQLTPFNVFNDNFNCNVGADRYGQGYHIRPFGVFEYDPMFFKPHIHHGYHNGFIIGFIHTAPECLEDYLVRLFYVTSEAFYGYNPYINLSSVGKDKIDPLYPAFIGDLSKDINLGLLKVSISGALNASKTLYDTLFLDNLVDLFGWEGKPVRWVTGPYSLLVQTEGEELKTFRAFMRDFPFTIKPPCDFTGDIMEFKSIRQGGAFFIEPEKPGRWILKPFWINFWGEIEYKLHKTDEPKPDYSRVHVKSRSEIRKL